jgi:ribosome recycling factor
MSALSLIEKAILASDLGINPSNDGRIIRLVFPALTEERRKQLSKDVSKYAEEAKVAVRQIRRDCIEKIKTMKKNSEITEDDQKRGEDKLQKITDEFVKRIDEIADAKTKEIMEI